MWIYGGFLSDSCFWFLMHLSGDKYQTYVCEKKFSGISVIYPSCSHYFQSRYCRILVAIRFFSQTPACLSVCRASHFPPWAIIHIHVFPASFWHCQRNGPNTTFTSLSHTGIIDKTMLINRHDILAKTDFVRIFYKRVSDQIIRPHDGASQQVQWDTYADILRWQAWYICINCRILIFDIRYVTIVWLNCSSLSTGAKPANLSRGLNGTAYWWLEVLRRGQNGQL